MAEKPELYVKTSCPYCAKVESFMESNGIELQIHNIDTDAAARSYLIENGGKRQVPCLFVDGKALYESNDIIDYLGREFGADKAAQEEDATSAAGGACSLDGSGCSF